MHCLSTGNATKMIPLLSKHNTSDLYVRKYCNESAWNGTESAQEYLQYFCGSSSVFKNPSF